MGEVLINEKVGRIAGWLLAVFSIDSIVLSNLLLSEALLTFILIVSAYSFILFLIQKQKRYILYSAILLGLATLTRPIALFLPLCLVIFILFYWRKQCKKAIISSLLLLIVYLLTISPWIIRNHRVFGFPHVTSNLGYTLFVHYVPYIEAASSKKELKISTKGYTEGVRQSIRDKGVLFTQQSEVWQQIGVRTIMKHPLAYTRLYLLGTATTILSGGSNVFYSLLGTPMDYRESLAYFVAKDGIWRGLKTILERKGSGNLLFLSLNTFLLLFMYCTAIYGVYRVSREKRYAIKVLYFLIIAYFVLPGPVGGMRFRVPIIPYITLLSGLGLYSISKQHI
ncbi:MAG: glycosyltransferase family 39 protein [bacterium]|nr:glycosyltransferase family 39 protein [bacterium]